MTLVKSLTVAERGVGLERSDPTKWLHKAFGERGDCCGRINEGRGYGVGKWTTGGNYGKSRQLPALTHSAMSWKSHNKSFDAIFSQKPKVEKYFFHTAPFGCWLLLLPILLPPGVSLFAYGKRHDICVVCCMGVPAAAPPSPPEFSTHFSIYLCIFCVAGFT